MSATSRQQQTPDADGDPDATSARLQRPPFVSLSVLVFAAYSAIFVEALACAADNVAGVQPNEQLLQTLHHLCAIYAFEILLAALCGWCVMAGGWTLSEIAIHHGLYVLAVMLNLQIPGATVAWADALVVSLLTAANEAALVLVASGAPKWFASCRRLYGFSIVLLLLLAELRCYVRAVHDLLASSESLSALLFGRSPEVLATNMPLLAICYHADLLRIYCKRWIRQLRHSHTS